MKLLPQLRAVAQQSAARQAGRLAKHDPKLTSERIKIVSLENNSPVTKLSLFVRAGSRHETGFNLGVSHCLRSAASLATKNRTAVALTRTVQQIGASLTTTGTKEHIIYSIESDRDKADVAIECLLDVVLDPQFFHWELHHLKHNMEVDLALHKQNHEERVVELLHQAAFRTTLGRPLYAPEFMLGNFEHEMLEHYTSAHYKPERMAIVGFGCDHDWLRKRTTSFINAPPPSVRHFPTSPNKPAEVVHKEKHAAAAPNDETAKYFGGQQREDADHNLALIAIAGEGASLGGKQSAAAFVLQRVFGVGPRVKWSTSQSHGRLAKAVAGAVPSGTAFAVSGINYNYSDNGLFGFFLSVDPAHAGKATRAAVVETSKIANGGLTDAELKIAKQQAKADLLYSLEHDANHTEALASSVLITGELLPSREQALSQIDAVSLADVVQVAKRAASSRTSMAAVGDLSDTPYLEQIIS